MGMRKRLFDKKNCDLLKTIYIVYISYDDDDHFQSSLYMIHGLLYGEKVVFIFQCAEKIGKYGYSIVAYTQFPYTPILHAVLCSNS